MTMIAARKKTTNIGVGIGLALTLAGQGLLKSAETAGTSPGLGLVLFLVGAAFFVWGCGQYAQAKGHHAIVGVLGLLWIIGLVALYALPDNHPEPKKMKKGSIPAA
jgi:hypothetical protein